MVSFKGRGMQWLWLELGLWFRISIMVMVSVKVRVERTTTLTGTKTAQFTGFPAQSSSKGDSFDSKHLLSVNSSVLPGNHVHIGGANMRAMHLESRSQELKDDSAAVLEYMQPVLE